MGTSRACQRPQIERNWSRGAHSSVSSIPSIWSISSISSVSSLRPEQSAGFQVLRGARFPEGFDLCGDLSPRDPQAGACPLPRSASALLRPRGLPPGPNPGKSKRLRQAAPRNAATLLSLAIEPGTPEIRIDPVRFLCSRHGTVTPVYPGPTGSVPGPKRPTGPLAFRGPRNEAGRGACTPAPCRSRSCAGPLLPPLACCAVMARDDHPFFGRSRASFSLVIPRNRLMSSRASP